MTKTTMIGDRCGKEFTNADTTYGKAVSIRNIADHDNVKHYELCERCVLGFVAFMKGGRNDNLV